MSENFRVTEGTLYDSHQSFVDEMVLCAAKTSPNIEILTKVVTGIGQSVSVTIVPTNELLMSFALGKHKFTTKSNKRLTNKMAAYHGFRKIIKPEIDRIFNSPTLSTFNQYASMVWTAIDTTQKDEWNEAFSQLDEESAYKWKTIFYKLTKATLEEDTESMLAEEEAAANQGEQLEPVKEEDVEKQPYQVEESKKKKKRPKGTPGYNEFEAYAFEKMKQLNVSAHDRSIYKKCIDVWEMLPESLIVDWAEQYVDIRPDNCAAWHRTFDHYIDLTLKK